MNDLTFRQAPRMSAASFARVLQRAGSPAAPDAANLYAIIVAYGFDPAVALAMFAHESTYGRYGVANRSLNWGNLRHGPRAYKIESGFGFYHNWADSLRDWCELIRDRYVARGLTTVEAVVPVYAPSTDGNVPARYIAQVTQLVAAWEASERAQAGLGPVSRIVAVSVARVRAQPIFGDNIVASKRKGDHVGGLLVEGAAFQGSNLWLKLRDGQFMHSSVLV
jgi:hypothetical protein